MHSHSDQATKTKSAIFTTLLSLSLFILVLSTWISAEENLKPTRWESTIQEFEKQDQTSPPPQGAVLFVGSSSIRMWKLDQYFPGLTAINRGFGGSFVEDSLYYADRIVLPYQPRVIVFYAGDNDINSGKSPEQVVNDYAAFVKKVHAALPQTRIIYIAIKPSIARWKLIDKMREANRLIQDFTRKDARLAFVDTDTPMIGPDGQPRKELFLDDGLHLNGEGYKLWTSLVKPLLQEKPETQK
ncbi:MAG: SGNH/GDSL hydrolase family protein [bacterium]